MANDQAVDYASTDSTPLKPPQVNLMQTMVVMWRPLVVIFLYWILQWERNDLTGAFIRSTISCPPPLPGKNGHCPSGTLFVAGQCQAEPPRSPKWSFSSLCADRNYVVARGTAIGGRLSSVSTFCNLIAQVFVGSMLVDTWGRKPVKILGLSGSTTCSLFFLIACLVNPVHCMSLAFLGVVIFSSSNAFPVAALAMASDLSHNDVIQRATNYTAMNILQHIGILVAFVAGFFVLALDLTDYTEVWGIFFGFSLLVVIGSCFVLRETLVGKQDSETQPLEAARDVETRAMLRDAASREGSTARRSGAGSLLSHAISEVFISFQLVWRDPFLRCGMFLHFLGMAAVAGSINITGGFAISVVGLTQAVASLAGVFQPAAIVCGSALCTVMLKAFGPYVTYLIGLVIALWGQVITGLPAIFQQEGLFWLGWIVVGLGWGISTPSITAIVSVRVVDKGDQGKLFSCMNFLGALGQTVGSYLWSNLFFKSVYIGTWKGGLGYYAAAVFNFVLVVGFGFLFTIYIVPEMRREQDKQRLLSQAVVES